MAAVPWAHVEAPTVIDIDGTRAFNVGDPVPLETARRLGLLGQDDSPPVLLGTDSDTSVVFVDGPIVVASDDGADGAPVDQTTTPDDASAPDETTSPPQAKAAAPKQGHKQHPASPES